MIKEEFEKKLSVLLDVLRGTSTENKSQLVIYGNDGTDNGIYFRVRIGELFTYSVEFGMGEEALLAVKNELGDAVIGMFSDYVVSKTCEIHISADF